jgi:ABC-type transporter Mla subunit MlaD
MMKRLFFLTLGLVAVGTFVAWFQSISFDLDFTERSISE